MEVIFNTVLGLVGNVRPMMRNPIVKWKRGIYISSSNGLAKYAHEMAHAFIYYPSQLAHFSRHALQSSISQFNSKLVKILGQTLNLKPKGVLKFCHYLLFQLEFSATSGVVL